MGADLAGIEMCVFDAYGCCSTSTQPLRATASRSGLPPRRCRRRGEPSRSIHLTAQQYGRLRQVLAGHRRSARPLPGRACRPRSRGACRAGSSIPGAGRLLLFGRVGWLAGRRGGFGWQRGERALGCGRDERDAAILRGRGALVTAAGDDVARDLHSGGEVDRQHRQREQAGEPGRAARAHAPQQAVLEQELVAQRAGDVEQDQRDADPREQFVAFLGGLVAARWRAAGAATGSRRSSSVGTWMLRGRDHRPAGQRGADHEHVEQHVHGLGEEAVQAAFDRRRRAVRQAPGEPRRA